MHIAEQRGIFILTSRKRFATLKYDLWKMEAEERISLRQRKGRVLPVWRFPKKQS